VRGMFLILRKVLLPTIEFGIKIVYEIVDNKIMILLIYVSLQFVQAVPDFYFCELAQKRSNKGKNKHTKKRE
jgi:hypothetical protein